MIRFVLCFTFWCLAPCVFSFLVGIFVYTSVRKREYCIDMIIPGCLWKVKRNLFSKYYIGSVVPLTLFVCASSMLAKISPSNYRIIYLFNTFHYSIAQFFMICHPRGCCCCSWVMCYVWFVRWPPHEHTHTPPRTSSSPLFRSFCLAMRNPTRAFISIQRYNISTSNTTTLLLSLIIIWIKFYTLPYSINFASLLLF